VFLEAWVTSTIPVEGTLGRDEGLYRKKVVRVAERPRRSAGRWMIDERRVG